ncbi:MAG: hypothetical protein IPM36_17975 [Lewinellaceae bacterium]|jgi:hypothetical protein|nr:hypothetical protein [Lewinellaceae bacterium]
MKTFVLFCMLALTAGFLTAQSAQYTTAMTAAVAQLDSAQTADDYQASANTFARIAAAEPAEWLPHYYAAFSNLMVGFSRYEKDLNKAIYAFDQSEALLEKANALAPQESELAVLKAYLLIGRLMENPMALGGQITPQVFAALEKAAALNPTNPRAPFLRGTYVLNMPEFYGGGANNAKPYFEKAAALFEQETGRGLLPHWGKRVNAEYLEKLAATETKD